MADSAFRINRGVTLNPQTSAPTSPTNGDIYYDSTIGSFVFYNQGKWINLSSRSDVASATNLTSSQFTTSIVQASLVRVTGSVASTVHGLTAGSDGQTVVLYNQSNQTMIVKNESATESGSANRIVSYNQSDITLLAGQTIVLMYDGGQLRWIAASSPGTGSGTGLGDDLITTQFSASFTDGFDESPTATYTAVDSTKTNATYSASKSLYQISYDASKTVSTSGTAVTMSGAPAFTVTAGDILISGGVAKRITAVSTQTSYTIESAFATNLSVAACTVSQAVHSKDVYNTAFDGNAISAAFSSSFSEILVDYEDSTTVNDNIFDVSTTPVIGFSASTDNSNWSGVTVRPTLTTTQISTLLCPTSGIAMYLRFFANKSSGSGTVNILKYKVYMQKVATNSQGAILNSALAFTNNVGTPINCTVGVLGGKTTITLNWQYPVGTNTGTSEGSLLVFINGQKIPRYVDATLTPDGSYTELSSNVIQLDTDYSTKNLSINVLLPAVYIDQSTQNTTNIANIGSQLTEGFQGFVKTSSVLSATTGTPSSSQFYSSITNRASITNISSDLKASMGISRLPIQQCFQIQSEYGSSGQSVFGVVNDSIGQVRLIGTWSNAVGTNGQYVATTTTNDFVEVTFYGTGLSMLINPLASMDFRVTTDNGTEGSNLAITYSTILTGRNYNANTVIPLVSGLSLGVHTVKIRNNAAAGIQLCGIQVLNESSSVVVNPGTSFVAGQAMTLSSQQSISYNSTFESGTLGTTGGRVLVYQKSDGTIAKAVTPVAALPSYLGSASHTNEEVARTHYAREFGAGRTDDFSRQGAGAAAAALYFTLEDGVTNLNSNNASFQTTAFVGGEGIQLVAGTSNFLTLTFVGTGLDVILGNDSTSRGFTTSVDGSASVGTTTVSTVGLTTVTVASGLPYGTHTVQFTNNSGVNSTPQFNAFVVYRAKTPTLPSGCVAISSYNILANFVANATSGANTIATGVLRRFAQREWTYFNTWNQSVNSAEPGGVTISANTNTAYAQHTFFGTGFDFRFSQNTNTSTWQMSVDGSTNLSGFTTSSYGAGITSFTASTGTLVTSTTDTQGNGIRVSGLSLGWHTFKIVMNSGTGNIRVEALDVITPVHSHGPSPLYDQQNTLLIGSQGLADVRNLSPIKDAGLQKKNIAQAVGLSVGPTTTSSIFVPCPDLSVTHTNQSGRIRINFDVTSFNTGANLNYFQIFIDGSPAVSREWVYNLSAATTPVTVGGALDINVSPGIHKIDIYWRTNTGTATARNADRGLLVEEI